MAKGKPKDPDYPHYPEDPRELARALFKAGPISNADVIARTKSERSADEAGEAEERVDSPTGADISPSPVFGDSGD